MINFDEYEMRLVQSSDANQYFALIESNRDRLATFLPVTCKENESPQLTKEYLQRKQAEADARTVFTMVIVHRATNRFSGFMVIKKIDWHAGDCELGYFIDRECEGQGGHDKSRCGGHHALFRKTSPAPDLDRDFSRK